VADERAMLEGWLEWQRSTLLWKCAGLTGDQLAERAVPPSTLSLLGLVRHMTDAERAWFRRHFRGEPLSEAYARPERPDAAFDDVSAEQAEADLARLQEEWARCRAGVDGAALDDVFTLPVWGEISLRWVYSHMIEEYARHIGHADLLRERIDGVTGQ